MCMCRCVREERRGFERERQEWKQVQIDRDDREREREKIAAEKKKSRIQPDTQQAYSKYYFSIHVLFPNEKKTHSRVAQKIRYSDYSGLCKFTTIHNSELSCKPSESIASIVSITSDPTQGPLKSLHHCATKFKIPSYFHAPT